MTGFRAVVETVARTQAWQRARAENIERSKVEIARLFDAVAGRLGAEQARELFAEAAKPSRGRPRGSATPKRAVGLISKPELASLYHQECSAAGGEISIPQAAQDLYDRLGCSRAGQSVNSLTRRLQDALRDEERKRRYPVFTILSEAAEVPRRHAKRTKKGAN